MKTKFLFKAFLNLVPLSLSAALFEGRGLHLEIPKLPTEKNISGKVQIYLSSHTSGGCPWSGITANPGDGNPFPLIKQQWGKALPFLFSESGKL